MLLGLCLLIYIFLKLLLDLILHLLDFGHHLVDIGDQLLPFLLEHAHSPLLERDVSLVVVHSRRGSQLRLLLSSSFSLTGFSNGFRSKTALHVLNGVGLDRAGVL